MAHFACPLTYAETLPPGYSRVHLLTIKHSGHVYSSNVTGPSGQYVWPMEELFARRKCKATVRERMHRLNPYGKEEGSICRGWFVHSPRGRAFYIDAVPMREYEQKWGEKNGAEVLIKQGRHKFVSRRSFENGHNGN